MTEKETDKQTNSTHITTQKTIDIAIRTLQKTWGDLSVPD